MAGDLGKLVGHARAAGDAVDQALRAFEDSGEDAFRRAHFPQDVHMDAALPAGDFMRRLGLGDAALDRIGDEFLMPVTASFAVVNLLKDLAVVVIGIGIDAGKSSHASRGGPCAGAFAVGYGNSFSAFD